MKDWYGDDMNNGFNAVEGAKELKRLQDLAVLDITTTFLDKLVSVAYREGRDFEYKTNQAHEGLQRRLDSPNPFG